MISLRITPHAIELRLELPNVAFELFLLLNQLVGLGAIDTSARRAAPKLVHVVRDPLLIARKLLGFLDGVLDVAGRASILLLVE